MKIIYDEDYIPEEPCLSCEKSNIEDIWYECYCDEKNVFMKKSIFGYCKIER